MKKIAAIFMFTLVFLAINSCSKHDDEHIIDCLGESLLTELKHSPDPANSKTINYSVQYNGTNKVTYVKWTFGDGTPIRNIMTPGSVSHTYTNAGTFEVKADVTLSRYGTSCTMTLVKNVVVE